MSIISKFAKTGNARCKAKNKAFCRYHGVYAPASASNLLNKINEAKVDLDKELDHPLPDLTLRGIYREKIRNATIEREILLAQAGERPVNLEKLSKELEVPVDKSLVDTIKASRDMEVRNYATNLRNELFTDPVENLIAEKGFPREAALKLNKGPVLRFKSWDSSLDDNTWDRYYDSASLGEKLDYRHVEKYANENGLTLITTVDRKAGAYAVVGFSYEKYGLTREQVRKASRNKAFKKKLQTYRTAVDYVKTGQSPETLAGGRVEKQSA